MAIAARSGALSQSCARLYAESGATFFRPRLPISAAALAARSPPTHSSPIVSFILFLNNDWDTADGGQLVLSQQISADEQVGWVVPRLLSLDLLR